MSRRKRPLHGRRDHTPSATPQPVAKLRRPQRVFSRRSFIAMVVVLLPVGLFVAARYASQRWYQQGLAALRIHQFELADRNLAKAAILDRRDGEVALMRARVAWVKGDQALSDKWIQQAIGEGMTSKRIDRERRLLQIRAGSAHTEYPRLSNMLQQHSQDGLATLEAFSIGFMARGDAGRAAEMLSYWEDADRTDCRLHYWRGMLIRTFGAEAESIEHFEKALRCAPDMTPARVALADVLTSLFFYAEALPHYQRLIGGQGHSDEAKLGQAICQLRTGATDDGISGLREYIAKHPASVVARVALAEQFQDADQPAEVVATIRPVLDSNPPDIKVSYLAASALARLGNQAQSQTYFGQFQQLNRQHETAKFLIANYQREPSTELAQQIAGELLQCKWEDAGTWILTALSGRPESVQLHQMMAEFLRRSERHAVAEHYQQQANRLRLKASTP